MFYGRWGAEPALGFFASRRKLRPISFAERALLNRKEVAHSFRARQRVVCEPNVIDVDRRHRRAPQSTRLENDHRLGAAGRAGDHDDAPACRPFDLTHESTSQPVLTARTGEPGKAFGIDERPVHGDG
jgi:hypothetical protein